MKSSVVVLGVSPVSRAVEVIARCALTLSAFHGAERLGSDEVPNSLKHSQMMAFYGSKSSNSKIKMDLTDDLLLKIKWVHWCPMPS